MIVSKDLGAAARDLGHFSKRLGVLALLVGVALVAGCGSSARKDFDLNSGEAKTDDAARRAEIAASFLSAPADGDKMPEYEIGEGDNLEIAFFTHPEQNRFVTVRPDGRVTMPFVGDVVAAGRTPSELASSLQDAYSAVLVSPRVDVIVQEIGARYYVIGNVSIPGEYKLERRTDILQGIARAGGYTGDSRLSSIVLLRRTPEHGAFAAVFDLRDYVSAENRVGNIELQPYDIVWVPRSAVSRWDNATRQLLSGIIQGEDAVTKGWSLVNFSDVYERQNF